MKRPAHRSVRALRAASGLRSPAFEGLESLETRRLLATFTVTNLEDSGAGSLRQAILEADALAGADIIEFQEGLTGEIELASGQLTIWSDLDIRGPGARALALDSGLGRVIQVASGVTASISGLTITGGNAREGGGIYNAGTLTLTGVAVADNAAPPNFDFGGRGGGIFNTGTLEMVNSTVSGNHARNSGRYYYDNGRGGGIYNNGTLTLTNVTVSGNIGAGIGGRATGGGIYSAGGSVTINNSTIVNNPNDDVEIEGGTLTVISSLLDSVDGALEPGSMSNLIGGITNLGPLADNGGPTDTHALFAGSNAIGAGINPIGLTTDQRGLFFSRTGNGGVDIGAYQTQTPPPSLVVSTLSNVSDGDYSQGNLSLREALDLANSIPGADTITFDEGIEPGTITLDAQLVLARGVTIIGPGAELLSISAAGASRVFYVNAGITATIEGLTITGGFISSGPPFNNEMFGGGILNRGTLTVRNVVVSGNTAPEGGGIRSFGTLTLFDSTVSGNTSTGGGGAGIRSSGPLTLTRSTVSGNAATSQYAISGGGIFATGVVTLTDSVVSGNSAMSTGSGRYALGLGGGIHAANTVLLTGSTISDNTASHDGGGIYATKNVIVTGSTISGNTSGRDGGGILASGKITLTDSTLSGNSADRNGGGAMTAGNMTVTRSTISGNVALEDGGGLHVADTLTVKNSTVTNNTAGLDGGGIHAATAAITRSTISGNDAFQSGGGVFAGTLDMATSTVSGNNARIDGGGIYAEVAISSSTISGNRAKERGGGVFGSGDIDNSTITDNEAQTLGGGIHTPGTIRLRSSIVAGNAGFDVSGTVAANSINNLVQDTTVALGLVNGVNGNILGVDPLLGPLAFNGGPTRTHALLSGSPAVDAGANPLGFNTDQRGQPFGRVAGAQADIGAFESQSLDPSSIALFGGANLDIPLGHETRPQRSNGTGFGPVEVDGESKSITYRISNDSGEVLVISLIEVRGQRPEDYSITDMPSLTVAPGASTDFTVTFDPTAFGTRRANIAIFSNDADRGRFTLRIAGRGMPDDSLPDIAVTGGTVEIRDNDRKARPNTGQRFGGVELGESITLVFTITNRGQGTLTFTSPIIRIVGPDADDFILSLPAASTLGPGATTTFTIEFTPSASGPRRATVEILSDDPDESPFDFRIIGTGL